MDHQRLAPQRRFAVNPIRPAAAVVAQLRVCFLFFCGGGRNFNYYYFLFVLFVLFFPDIVQHLLLIKLQLRKGVLQITECVIFNYNVSLDSLRNAQK